MANYPKGQQITMWVGVIVALLALVPLSSQLELDAQRAASSSSILKALPTAKLLAVGTWESQAVSK